MRATRSIQASTSVVGHACGGSRCASRSGAPTPSPRRSSAGWSGTASARSSRRPLLRARAATPGRAPPPRPSPECRTATKATMRPAAPAGSPRPQATRSRTRPRRHPARRRAPGTARPAPPARSAGWMTTPCVTVPSSGWSRSSNAVVIPKFAPAPRRPQNSSGSSSSARADAAAVGRDELHGEDVVDRQPESALQPAHPAAERQAPDARVRDDAHRADEAVPLRRVVELTQQRPATHARGARLRIDLGPAASGRGRSRCRRRTSRAPGCCGRRPARRRRARARARSGSPSRRRRRSSAARSAPGGGRSCRSRPRGPRRSRDRPGRMTSPAKRSVSW